MESDNNDELEDVDPDYKINTTALRKIEEKEEEDSKFTSERIKKIIAEEFDKELSHRQKQLEEIEDKICKAQKLLHLVRYVLITSYYNKKSLEHENPGAESNLTNFDAQSRIHPAVKKLLGKNTSLEVLNARGKRRACNKNNYISESSTSQLSAPKKPKLEPKETDECSTSTFQGPDNNQNLQKNRKKTKYRIVVGNISKWMPSLENDNTTHKWMVYVRGLKEAVDISRVVNKVIFYLHPSYKPHDIVEIDNYPFHLSRRGWGEFPLRVQIFFKSPLNKPISIVHNLKLDKTYTGRQTLGNETIVDLYLHDDDFDLDEREKENIHKLETTIVSDSQKMNDTFTNVDIKQELVENDEHEDYTIKSFTSEGISEEYDTDPSGELNSTSFEHNYCYEEETVKEEVDVEWSTDCNSSLLLDHPYSLPSDEHKLPCNVSSVKNTDVATKEQNNTLVYGLGEFYTTDNGGKPEVTINRQGSLSNKQEKLATMDKCVFKTFTTATGQPIRFLPQSFNKVLLSNGNIIQIQLVKPSQCVLKKINCDKPQNVHTEEREIDYEKYRLSLPKKRFKNMGEVLPYLFKRLPLWNKLASDIDFKCTYPFVAVSEAEYKSWNIGKQANSEWCRAKTIKKILSTEIFPDFEKWNTKTFFMYGRSHGYSTTIKCGTLFRRYSEELRLLESCFSKSLHWNRFLVEHNSDDIDVTIDIETPSASNLDSGKNNALDISDPSLRHHCAFVKEAALDCGIILKPEEISDGVIMNAAERMMFEAVKCFAENVIRRSRHHLVCQNQFREETSEITVREVQHALDERLDIKSIMNFQQQKREMEFFL